MLSLLTIGKIKANNREYKTEYENECNWNIKKIRRCYKTKISCKKIGIFGSFARGEETEGSDIDVLVDLKDGYETFDNFMDLKYFLEDLFNREVDLVTIDALRPQLKDDILQEVIYA